MIKIKQKGEPSLQVIHCVRKPVPPGTKRRGPRPMRGSEWAIPPILAQIISTGLRRIQALGQNGNPERCAIEAEHVQSLPPILVELEFDPEVLNRYWNVERVAFVEKSIAEETSDFQPLWANLAQVLQTCKDEVASGGEIGRAHV